MRLIAYARVGKNPNYQAGASMLAGDSRIGGGAIQMANHQGERQKAARRELWLPRPAGLVHNRDGSVTRNGFAWCLPSSASARAAPRQSCAICVCSNLLLPVPAWSKS
jgi:hypothetical protein